MSYSGGERAAWTRDLEGLYASQPVFAIIGGLVPGPWQTVADFCDKFEVPCLFPETGRPAAAPESGYTIYFSRGVPGSLPGDDPSGERTRMKNWQLSRGIAPGNERIQLNTQFTLALLEDSLRRMAGHYLRDYLIETIERETETARNPGVYPRLSLGPGQRFAFKGAWILP